MDDPKKRGKQHLKNKIKYKHRPKEKAPVQVSKSSTLMTNWDRYKDILTSSDSPRGADFSLLAEAPISKGSHFQFKSDVHDRFDVNNTLVDSNGIFNMDLNLLGLSIACIPFSERCDIPENYFLDTQIKRINKNAAESAVIYQQALLKDVNNTTKMKGIGEISTTKIHDVQDEWECVHNNKSSRFIPDYRDVTENLENNMHNKLIHPSINKLNELEEKLDKLDLISDSKISHVNISNNHQYKGLLTPPQLKATLKNTSNMTDQEDSLGQGESSLLETESLQNWLDDILGYRYDIIDMSGRDRDIGRKWESGSEKRKRKAERTASNQALSLNMIKFLNQTASGSTELPESIDSTSTQQTSKIPLGNAPDALIS